MIKFIKELFPLVLLVISTCLAPDVCAQRVALKTNTIDWLALSPNLTLETRLSSRLTLQLGVAANPTHISVADLQLTNFRVEPELRYWFNRPMARHFIAISATAGSYNLRYRDHHFVGDAVAAGVSYGYALVLGSHWNMEAECGIGLAHMNAKNYHGSKAPATTNYNRLMPVPIRLGLSFSYIFK